jgi:hypothetical protein
MLCYAVLCYAVLVRVRVRVVHLPLYYASMHLCYPATECNCNGMIRCNTIAYNAL